MKIAVSVVLGLHMLLGNLCMMEMVYAQEMALSSGSHDELMEMAMTPVIPMTPALCEHCLKVKKVSADPMRGMPCMSGHCLTHSAPNTPAGIPSSNVLASAVLSIPAPAFPSASIELHSQLPSTAPPGALIRTNTIVLRV